MSTGNERWVMMVGKAVMLTTMIALIIVQRADAKTTHRTTSKRSAAHTKATHTKARSTARTQRAHSSQRAKSSYQRVARSPHIGRGHVVLVHPALRRIPDRSYASIESSYPPADVLKLALRAYACGEGEGQFETPYLTIIDYSQPSVDRRLWVLDVRTKRVLFNELVAHGLNSGENFAVSFSNDPGSRQSSIGLYRTEDIYLGQHGGSLRLSGLEPGFNDLALERQIVIHGASYVSASHVERFGQLGRSWGCPALPLGVSKRIIERIQGGSAVFVYYPDHDWLRSSRYLHCGARLARG